MRYLIALLTLCLFPLSLAAEPKSGEGCYKQSYEGAGYAICIFDPKTSDIRLFSKDKDGHNYGHFGAVNRDLAKRGQRLSFAMNGGMYHKDRSPVGGYIEGGKERQPMNSNAGPGNFHMLPNGVFWTAQSKYGGGAGAYVASTQYFTEGAHGIVHATQSGPMLVIDGKLHPKFRKGSDSLRLRNGVGTLSDGRLAFVISDKRVNFYDFASLFKDHLGSKSALYLDGTISRLYAPSLERDDLGVAMGPIIGVVEKVVAPKP